MKFHAAFFFAAMISVPALSVARADTSPPKSQKEQTEAAPKTPEQARDEIYARLAASKNSDETEGLVGLLLGSYSESGSDTGDLLLARARKAIAAKEYDSAGKILDATVTLMPNWAEVWNARATLRYLDDDLDGSMADIAQTLKREPRHIGALAGMAMILTSQDKDEQALKVYERLLAIAPHWRRAEEAADELRAAIAGQQI